jgi:PmbA protein
VSQNLENIAKRVLSAAKKAGADAADTLIVDGTSVSIEVRAAALEHAERSEGVDLGLRVFKGHRQASVSISDASDDAIAQMAERAVAMAAEAPEDPYCGLAEPSHLARDWDLDGLELCDPSAAPAPDALQSMALEAEAAAQSVDGVSQVQGAGAGYSDTSLHLAASNGFSGGYRRTSTSVSCVAISGTGTSMERDYAAESRSHATDLPGAEEIGRLAGERAVQRKGAKRPPTGAYPVLFDERVSSSLIGHLMAAINGTSVVRGSSWLLDGLGKQVLPKGIDLIEDPHRARVSGSRPFDGEGLPVQRRAIVQDGVLQSWTLDLSTACQLNLKSTGNAARGVSGPPSPSVGNLALTQSDASRAALMAEMGTGLLVTSMIGSTINPNTGDYSRGASGFWVENGEITGPVNECTVAGNLRDFLLRMTPANDARTYLSRVVPSLLVEGLTIAGD